MSSRKKIIELIKMLPPDILKEIYQTPEDDLKEHDREPSEESDERFWEESDKRFWAKWLKVKQEKYN